MVSLAPRIFPQHARKKWVSLANALQTVESKTVNLYDGRMTGLAAMLNQHLSEAIYDMKKGQWDSEHVVT